MKAEKHQLWVFAGQNGAGKSTLVLRFRVPGRLQIVNPDEIAKLLTKPNENERELQAKAGRMAIAQRNALLSEKQSFGVETTLTGKTEIKLMQEARALGCYKVNLVYIGLSSAAQSNSRVAIRVKEGGHDVPEEDVMRRYTRSLENLPKALLLADRVRILDNSDKGHRLLLSVDHGRVKFLARALPKWFQDTSKTFPEAMQQDFKRFVQGRDQASPKRLSLIPDNYKPSANAIAATEQFRKQGLGDEAVRHIMYGIDLSNEAAAKIGAPTFQARTLAQAAKAEPSEAPQAKREEPIKKR